MYRMRRMERIKLTPIQKENRVVGNLVSKRLSWLKEGLLQRFPNPMTTTSSFRTSLT